jgi:NADPH-dependent glutamate synthase beta subunit-like oxidoreductase
VSIGYKGVAIAGTEPWFDETQGVLKNIHGKVDSAADDLGGLYTAGWLKRGPSGIIGTNIPDAKDTVATMLHDAESASPKQEIGQTSLKVLLEERSVAFVDWEAYRRIDATEMSDGHKRNPEQPREKFTTTQELLQIAKDSSS